MRRHLFAAALSAALLLAPRAEAAPCAPDRIAILHAVAENGRIFVPGSLDGHPVRFLIGTASESFILPKAAASFGLPQVLGARFQPKVYVDEIKTGPVKAQSTVLDGLDFHEQIFHVIGQRSDFGAPDEVAVLGRDFLGQYDVDFDVPGGRITFYHYGRCKRVSPTDWPLDDNSLDMTAGSRVEVEINGRKYPATVDSTARTSSITLAAAAEFGISPALPGISAAGEGEALLTGQPILNWQGLFPGLTLDDEAIRPVWLRLQAPPAPPETVTPAPAEVPTALTLGADFLMSHRVLFANSVHTLYFAHLPEAPFLDAPGPDITDRERSRQIDDLTNAYHHQLLNPALDLVRDKITLDEVFKRRDPPCQPGPADAFPTPREQVAIRKWAEMRAAYYHATLGLSAPPNGTPEPIAALAQDFYTSVLTTASQTARAIDDLAEGRISYCRFAAEDRELLEAGGRNSDAILREIAKKVALQRDLAYWKVPRLKFLQHH